MATYRVPTSLAGMTLSDFTRKYGGDVGTFGNILGIGTNTPFTEGMSLSTRDLPGINPAGSGEYQLLNQYFTPESTFQNQKQAAFQAEQQGKLDEFTGRLNQVPENLEAIRQEMGIPEAFQTFGELGETARGAAQRVEDMPEAIRIATQGKDVSAGQLGRMTAARQQEALPGLRDVGRALESSGAGLESLLSDFASRTQSMFAPFELEAGLLGQNIAQQFDLYKTQISADLDRELANLSRQTTLDVAQINKAAQLAQLEQTADSISFQDLGDRIGIFDFAGNLLRTEKKGKLSTLGSTNDGW